MRPLFGHPTAGTRLRRCLFGLAVTVALMASSLGSTSRAGALSPQDRTDITRVTEYLNQMKTLQAEFVQASPSGQIAKGRLFMQRPNRLRFEYDPPSPLLLVADGLWLIMHDRELDQVDRWPIEDTPLGVLVAKEVDLTRRTEVVGVAREPGILALTFRDRESPEEGSVTVIFSEPPLTLRQWRVVDAQGEATDLSIRNPRINVALDPALFTFQDNIDGDQDRGQ